MTSPDADGSMTNASMTVFEFALYRFAFQRATPAQREKLDSLAQKADAGDKAADKTFRLMVYNLVMNGEDR